MRRRTVVRRAVEDQFVAKEKRCEGVHAYMLSAGIVLLAVALFLFNLGAYL